MTEKQFDRLWIGIVGLMLAWAFLLFALKGDPPPPPDEAARQERQRRDTIRKSIQDALQGKDTEK